MTPVHFHKMFPTRFNNSFPTCKVGWKTNFDYKITSVTAYATYSDGRQEKHSFPLGENFDEIPITYLEEISNGGRIKLVKKINAYKECNEWFSFKEGYGIVSFPEAHAKIRQLYADVMSKDYFGDVFFTFEPSIMLDQTENWTLEVSLDRDGTIQ